MTQPIEILPAIALRGTTILPDMIVHFDISREKSIKAVEAAMVKDQRVFLITQKDPETENPGIPDLYQVGTVAFVKQVVKLPQDVLRVLVEGYDRAELLSLEQEKPFLKAEIAVLEPEDERKYNPTMIEAMMRSLRELFQQYSTESNRLTKDQIAQIMESGSIEELLSQISVNLSVNYQSRQKILEAVTLEERYEIIAATMTNEIQVMKISHDLQRRLKVRVDKNQRDYILREQMKLIREELGEESTSDTADEYMKQLEELPASQEVKDKIVKEIKRFRSMNSALS